MSAMVEVNYRNGGVVRASDRSSGIVVRSVLSTYNRSTSIDELPSHISTTSGADSQTVLSAVTSTASQSHYQIFPTASSRKSLASDGKILSTTFMEIVSPITPSAFAESISIKPGGFQSTVKTVVSNEPSTIATDLKPQLTNVEFNNEINTEMNIHNIQKRSLVSYEQETDIKIEFKDSYIPEIDATIVDEETLRRDAEFVDTSHRDKEVQPTDDTNVFVDKLPITHDSSEYSGLYWMLPRPKPGTLCELTGFLSNQLVATSSITIAFIAVDR